MTKREWHQRAQAFKERTQWIANISSKRLKKETAQEQERRIEALLRPGAYARFFDYYFRLNESCPLGDAPCARFHAEAYRSLLQKKIVTQFRLWFRGAAKSMQTNIGNAFALKCRKELRFMLLIGSNATRAKLLLADLQAQLEANERIIRDFGKQIQHGHWRDGIFETQDNCYFMALGIDQPFRGLRRYSNRVDFAVVDDIEDHRKVGNPALIERRVDKILGDLGASFQKNRQRLVIANNYTTHKGVVAGLLRRLKNKEHVRISRVNLTNEQGHSTWSSYYRAKDVAAIHNKYDSYTLQREYYNKPIEQGKVFKNEWIHFETSLGEKSHAQYLTGFWDLSYTKKGDYKAFALVGMTEKKLVVWEVFCQKCELSYALHWHFELAEKLAAEGCRAMFYYDGMASQEHVFGPLFKKEGYRRQRLQDVPLPYKKLLTDKHSRIEGTLSPLFFHQSIVFSKYLQETSDMEAGLEQLMAFERGGQAHDDFPDALSVAIQICMDKQQAHTSLQHHKACLVQQRRQARSGF